MSYYTIVFENWNNNKINAMCLRVQILTLLVYRSFLLCHNVARFEASLRPSDLGHGSTTKSPINDSRLSWHMMYIKSDYSLLQGTMSIQDRCSICLKTEWGLPISNATGLPIHENCAIMSEGEKVAPLDKVAVVLDVESFFVDGKHNPRELSWVDHRGDHGNVKFKMPCKFDELSDKDKRTALFVIRKVTGLRFENNPAERGLNGDELERVILALYQNSKTRQKKSHGLQRRSHRERLVANIPSIDIEEHGCPKYVDMLKAGHKPKRNCGQHAVGIHFHCATEECYAFFKWIRQRLEERKNKRRLKKPTT